MKKIKLSEIFDFLNPYFKMLNSKEDVVIDFKDIPAHIQVGAYLYILELQRVQGKITLINIADSAAKQIQQMHSECEKQIREVKGFSMNEPKIITTKNMN